MESNAQAVYIAFMKFVDGSKLSIKHRKPFGTLKQRYTNKKKRKKDDQ